MKGDSGVPYRTKKDIYTLLKDMSGNMEKLFESLDVAVPEYSLESPNRLTYYIEYLLYSGTVLKSLENMNKQMQQAIEQNEIRKIEAWSSKQERKLLEKQMVELQKQIAARDLQIEQQKQSYHQLEMSLQQADQETHQMIQNIISFRDSIIMREGLVSESEEEKTDDLKKLLNSLLKETAQLLIKSGITILDEKGKFDSSIHIVMGTTSTDDSQLHDCVAKVFRPGYKLDNKILRPQEVILYTYKPS